ncbi:bifunctional 3-(3-hydroxy-phenyl)propionate/3-hydroxycinnamic acid hydroxylase [Pusillimonas caeni]|uniref:bifunctional 3-(3-hydroxy-phenyl)propionate/3-hydroxycinnamic acid hydroxylase n=1 Tax=Pusillimonas caeni TaxID=1348472 RepID=UPI000E59AC6C|nr:bifunctional 3-(3-hydroxy-phenyl)propionate/3-hydroxycinnamic acid hydroxylase [Pusillimonas caeni]TFL15764.1 bifunctional 3-(3-hydroxy-phenyl)propionate/3-hydroxycinnamic acid hydroxylase [Pusillimonas caeni]
MEAARQEDTWDVIIVGAGPVGLLIANYLGGQGLRVAVLERMRELIDYPRGVGMDDECLRSFQAVGLAEAVLPHTTPLHWLRFVTGRGRTLAALEPGTDEFGWSRRNGFIQPLVDRVLFDGLARYPGVSVHFGHEVEAVQQDENGVAITTQADGVRHRFSARYAVGCDGGRSTVRKALGIPFEGKTEPNRWIVVDLNNDPLATPHAWVYCKPSRPYVSIALPHGVRRFEFMLFDKEAEGDTVPEPILRAMLAEAGCDPDRVDIIRARVYTHSGRLAARFRDRRILLAGDAAHIMPVWQGQGYNSGIRDATNLSWKLALVLKGIAGDSLLDSYEDERRAHANAMIGLSVMAGKVLSITNPAAAALRDAFFLMLNIIPPVKRYIVGMRFKPMPRYRHGALVYPNGVDMNSPVGTLFIQPRVAPAPAEEPVLLDEVLGDSFAILCWGIDPSYWMSEQTRTLWKKLDARLISVWPATQLGYQLAREGPGVQPVADVSGRLKAWFDRHGRGVVFLRPDRFIAALCGPQQIDATTQALRAALKLDEGGRP